MLNDTAGRPGASTTPVVTGPLESGHFPPAFDEATMWQIERAINDASDADGITRRCALAILNQDSDALRQAFRSEALANHMTDTLEAIDDYAKRLADLAKMMEAAEARIMMAGGWELGLTGEKVDA